jgi:hypothetical protein
MISELLIMVHDSIYRQPGLTVCVLSLHVWRKTLRGGMPAVLLTTTKSAAAERPRESRDRDLALEAFSTLHLVANEFLLG